MATIINLTANEVVHALGLFCILLLVHKGNAYEFVVGGQKGWSVPRDSNSNPYIQWAQRSRFQVGDSLVFNYPSGQDSVIEVSSQDYGSCNTDAYTEKFSDGHTVIKLNQSGSHFFISGNKSNCLKNEKLVVIVLSDRNNNNKNTNQTSPPSPSSPSPSPLFSTQSLAPSPAPSQQVVPPPPSPSPPVAAPPPQQEAPSPPSPVTSNPTPAPVSDQPSPPSPPHNAASSILLSFAGSVGTFLASVLIFSF